MNISSSRLANQQGAALLVTLCLMLLVMLMGVSAMRTALNAEKSARGERDRQVALHGAEAALEDAERDIEGGSNPQSERAAMFAPGSADGFVAGCGAGPHSLGLCLRVAEPAPPAWQSAALASADGGSRAVGYGRFTGATMPFGKGTLPARLPRYIIELMPYARAGHDASTRTGNFYRITAIGFGANVATYVVLQSFYLKAGEHA